VAEPQDSFLIHQQQRRQVLRRVNFHRSSFVSRTRRSANAG
jgi:hypothetical protein